MTLTLCFLIFLVNIAKQQHQEQATKSIAISTFKLSFQFDCPHVDQYMDQKLFVQLDMGIMFIFIFYIYFKRRI